MTLTVAQAFKVALDLWEIAQEGEWHEGHLVEPSSLELQRGKKVSLWHHLHCATWILRFTKLTKWSNADTTQPLSQIFFPYRQKQEGPDLLLLCCEQRAEGDNRHSGCPNRSVHLTTTSGRKSYLLTLTDCQSLHTHSKKTPPKTDRDCRLLSGCGISVSKWGVGGRGSAAWDLSLLLVKSQIFQLLSIKMCSASGGPGPRTERNVMLGPWEPPE